MLHGDISNYEEDVIGFRVEGSLLEIPTGIKFPWKKMEINKNVVRAMETIYRRTTMCSSLIMNYKLVTPDIENFLEDHAFYNRIIPIYSEKDIRILLNSGEISYYVDENKERRWNVQHGNAYDIDMLYSYVISDNRRR